MICKILTSQAKVFSDREPADDKPIISVLKGETASFQVAVKTNGQIALEAGAPGFKTVIREVADVPVRLPTWEGLEDDDYIGNTPGLYPDLLKPLLPGDRAKLWGWWKSFRVDLEPLDGTRSGTYTAAVKVHGLDWEEKIAETEEMSVELTYTAVSLPARSFIMTKWFYCDCLADYYHVEPFSEEHWKIVENFVKSAVRLGQNMILTPIHTPPLDTYVGGERTTVQLIDVRLDNGEYSFNFDGLRRWIKMCLDCGMEYFEMAHLYSQWGATSAPKIMATVDGEYRRLFGWETPALGGEYGKYLSKMLPALAEVLSELGVADRCRFHVSDEPHGNMLEHYLKVRDQAKAYLPGFIFMDALSDFSFYEQGAVESPAVASDSGDMKKFMECDGLDLWIYYCCGQVKDVSNSFIAMPYQRTRILGLQCYLCNVKGFLNWGFNFYNAQVSRYRIDPFYTTDSDGAFPAGDAFIVYPGENGEPLESLRYMALRDGLHDLRALQLLESLAGREFVTDLVKDCAGMDITLSAYPRNIDFLPTLRARVNAEIALRA